MGRSLREVEQKVVKTKADVKEAMVSPASRTSTIVVGLLKIVSEEILADKPWG
jgi:hypothetical protein